MDAGTGIILASIILAVFLPLAIIPKNCDKGTDDL